MAKRKRKNDEYYFDVSLECGSEARDLFEKLFEVHDYFIELRRGQALQISAQSLFPSCRFTIGIYDADYQPLDVQIVAPDGIVHLKDAPFSGEYIVRLRCETETTGDYQIAVSCDKAESLWQQIQANLKSVFRGKQ